jgi:3-deoxy-7-phosphoheptulonate synthase
MLIAGQCSMDGHFIETSTRLASYKEVTHLRAGLFKPRSSPNRWSGMGNESGKQLEEGLSWIRHVKESTGLKIVAEAMNLKQIEILYDYTDVFQIGSRNQTDSELLKEFGKLDKPVLLKRGFGTTISEFITYTDFIANEGNKDIILCERGIRTFDTYCRNTFDINAIPILKQNTPYKVIGDASHGTGLSELVTPVSLASLVAGADGVMVEVHAAPHEALTDGEQSLDFYMFDEFIKKYRKVMACLTS